MIRSTAGKLFSIFISCALFLASPVSASEIEDILEESMKEALVKTGIADNAANGIAQRFMFIGAVMIKNSEHLSVADNDALFAQADNTGRAFGKALGFAYKIYGDKKLQDAATVMMHSVRAGVSTETAAETFTVLAVNGYAFDAAVSLLHDASEFVRSSLLPDNGVSLCEQIRKMASGKEPMQTMINEIRLASNREELRQERLLAQKEAERNKREAGGNGGSSSVRRRNSDESPGRGGSGGGSINASSSGGSTSSEGSASSRGSAGGDSSSSGSTGDSSSGGGSSSSGGGSGGDSGSSGGDSSSGSSGGDSGSSSGGNSGSGGGDSGAGNSSSGSGGDSGGSDGSDSAE
ncbi:MAG: hypothetical protein LBS93_02395 [Synergistaceae bacterium]|nr:hypothetical protein [Synergistaceae bacterium]